MSNLSDILTSTFSFNLPEDIEEGLQEFFPTMEDVFGASINDLCKIPGVGKATAEQIKLLSNKFASGIKEEAKAESSDEEVSSSKSKLEKKMFLAKPSRKELAEQERLAKLADSPEGQRKYVKTEIVVDRTFIYRNRVPLEESTCEVCGFDILRDNKMGVKFEELDELDQSRVKAALREHVKRLHSSPADKMVISGVEKAQTSWVNPQTIR